MKQEYKYTNPARGIPDFCKQKLLAPPLEPSSHLVYVIIVNDCYFDSIAQCSRVLHNIQVYCAMYEVKFHPYVINFGSIVQCLNMLRNVPVYCAMSEIKVDPMKWPPHATILDKDKIWTKRAENCSACTEDEDEEPIQNIKGPPSGGA